MQIATKAFAKHRLSQNNVNELAQLSSLSFSLHFGGVIL